MATLEVAEAKKKNVIVGEKTEYMENKLSWAIEIIMAAMVSAMNAEEEKPVVIKAGIK